MQCILPLTMLMLGLPPLHRLAGHTGILSEILISSLGYAALVIAPDKMPVGCHVPASAGPTCLLNDSLHPFLQVPVTDE